MYAMNIHIAKACWAIECKRSELCELSTWDCVSYTGPIFNGPSIYFREKRTLAFTSGTIKNCFYVLLLSLYSLSSTIIIFWLLVLSWIYVNIYRCDTVCMCVKVCLCAMSVRAPYRITCGGYLFNTNNSHVTVCTQIVFHIEAMTLFHPSRLTKSRY